MFYRETGQYKTSYEADMALFPIRQDRIGMALILLIAFVIVPLTLSSFCSCTLPPSRGRLMAPLGRNSSLVIIDLGLPPNTSSPKPMRK